LIAVQRESSDLTKSSEPPVTDIGYYASSLSLDQYDYAAILDIIRGHWSAIENGTHYRRDVSLGEDACRTTERKGAEVLACLRNLAIGVYELERERKRRLTPLNPGASSRPSQAFGRFFSADAAPQSRNRERLSQERWQHFFKPGTTPCFT